MGGEGVHYDIPAFMVTQAMGLSLLVEMQSAYLFVSAISGGSTLGIVTSRDCDLGLVGFEITLLVERVGSQLTPTLITELKNSLVTV